MIISNSKRYIFVHIHKTGGTSVSHALEPTLAWNDVFCTGQGEYFYLKHFKLSKHSHASAVQAVVGDDVWNSYSTFAVVRNPYFRIISLYTWLKRVYRQQGWRRHFGFLHQKNTPPWGWPGMHALLDTKDFPGFIRHEEFLGRAPAAKAMFDFLSDGNELLVKHLIRLENMQEDFANICAEVGLEGVELGHRNKSKSKVALGDYYQSQEDLDYIYALYRKDFEVFGYEKATL